MKSIFKKAALAAALATASLSAYALDTNITVYANVDPTLAFLKADGSRLDDQVKLEYAPKQGLIPWTETVRIFSNDQDKDLEISLGSALVLQPKLGNPSAPRVPMTVSLNGVDLTPAAQDFKADELFNGAIDGASIPMELRIAQTTRGDIAVAGIYQGMASIIINQKTTGP